MSWMVSVACRIVAAGALLSVLLAAQEATAAGFVADMKTADGRSLGHVVLTDTAAGVLMRITLKGLPPGPHAFHVHGIGACKGDFSSAGPIYNPLGAKHGLLNEEGPMSGDLPNIFVPANGEIDVEMLGPFITLSLDAEETLMDANGAALVIHAGPDDHRSQPEGGSGARIACGVVEKAR